MMLAFLVVLVALAAVPVQATTMVVNELVTGSKINKKCSLWEAIAAAETNRKVDGCPAGQAAGDVIVLPAGTFPLPQMVVKESLEIRGTSVAVTLLTEEKDATHPDALLVLDHPQATLTLRKLALTKIGTGDRPRGSVWNIAGHLRLIGAVVEKTVPAVGGAVYTHWGAKTTLRDSRLQANIAPPGKPGGGALVNAGTLRLFRTEVSFNTSNEPGAGLYVAQGAQTMLRDAQVLDNRQYQAEIEHGSAGGIYNDRGTVDLFGGTIARNRAPQNGGLLNLGGTARLDGTLIMENDAALLGSGGGLVNLGSVTDTGADLQPHLEVRNCVILDNSVGDNPFDGWADCLFGGYPPDVWENNFTGLGTGCPFAPLR